MREFKYNVVDLICYVRDRPCLWDKTIENYKDRVERRSAWEEIFNNLDETYEEMTPEEKRITGDIVVRKWTNVRDSYMKSLRTRPGEKRRKYMYGKNLKFLDKNATEAALEGLSFNEDESSESAVASYLMLSSPATPETPTSTPEPFIEFPPTVFLSSGASQSSTRLKKKRKESEVTKKDLLEQLQKKSRNDTRPDEKETMLLSFLPYIKDMNETEMMDLHMEILTTIRNIKGKRARNPSVSANVASGSSTPNSFKSQLPLTPNSKPAIIKKEKHQVKIQGSYH